MRSLRSRLHRLPRRLPRRHALATALGLGVGAVASTGVQAQSLPPDGIGVYVSGSVVGTNNYVGNGTVSYATGPGISIYSGGGPSVDGGPLFAVTSPLAMPLGLTAATVSAIGSSGPGGTGLGEVVSTADLASGVLRASASGVSTAGYVQVGPTAARSLTNSMMQDRLTFAVASGAADITVTAHLDGFFAFHDPIYANTGQSMFLTFGGAAFNEVGYGTPTSSSHGTSGASGYAPPYGWQSHSFSNETPEGFDFTGVVHVVDGETDRIQLGLSLDCWGADCGFMHTGSIGLSLPEGVSYTSASGVFLTDVATVTPVPEPETWALMLVGLGVVGRLARRRRVLA